MERQHDFRVDDFAFMGIVFLLLVALGKEPFPALVGSGSNGRLAFTPLDNSQIKVRAWWHDECDLLSPGVRAKKKQETKIGFLLIIFIPNV